MFWIQIPKHESLDLYHISLSLKQLLWIKEKVGQQKNIVLKGGLKGPQAENNFFKPYLSPIPQEVSYEWLSLLKFLGMPYVCT